MHATIVELEHLNNTWQNTNRYIQLRHYTALKVYRAPKLKLTHTCESCKEEITTFYSEHRNKLHGQIQNKLQFFSLF